MRVSVNVSKLRTPFEFSFKIEHLCSIKNNIRLTIEAWTLFVFRSMIFGILLRHIIQAAQTATRRFVASVARTKCTRLISGRSPVRITRRSRTCPLNSFAHLLWNHFGACFTVLLEPFGCLVDLCRTVYVGVECSSSDPLDTPIEFTKNFTQETKLQQTELPGSASVNQALLLSQLYSARSGCFEVHSVRANIERDIISKRANSLQIHGH